MTKTSLICGSLATDTIMQFPGRFGESLLADQLHKVNVSFLVPTLRREVIQDAGHMLHHDQPEALAAVIESFLR